MNDGNIEERKGRMSDAYHGERARLEAMSLFELLRQRNINRWAWVKIWFRRHVLGER